MRPSLSQFAENTDGRSTSPSSNTVKRIGGWPTNGSTRPEGPVGGMKALDRTGTIASTDLSMFPSLFRGVVRFVSVVDVLVRPTATQLDRPTSCDDDMG